MDSFNEQVERLTKDGGDLPGIAAIVADDTGTIRYSKSFGSSPKGPVTIDSTMWVASCTKLLTTISVLQCVEKGLIKIDEPVETILPELGDKDILYGFDDETKAPLMKKAQKKITMRQLLTHTSGLSYDAAHPMLVKWREYQGQEPTSKAEPLIDELNYPLVFEPGEGFAYGVGLDWAGRAVERVNNNTRLGEYMQTNIWKPLGMTNSTFNPVDHPEIQEKMAGLVLRTEGSSFQPIPHPIGSKQVVDDCGGSGMFTSAADYIKVLISILQDDGKLLKSETVADMFKPQMPDSKPLNDIVQDPAISLGLTLGMEPGRTYDWGWGGILTMKGTTGRRSDGTMTWSGLTNPAWWIDRERKTCGFMAIQLLPHFDTQAISLFGKLESMAWEAFGKP